MKTQTITCDTCEQETEIKTDWEVLDAFITCPKCVMEREQFSERHKVMNMFDGMIQNLKALR